MTDDKKVAELRESIIQAEKSLEAAKKALFELTGEDLKPSSTTVPANLRVAADGKVIEGVFNGENMVGPEGKIFPVPANYASKSKLIEGDRLKLTIAEDGSFIFKQIGPAERKKLTGELIFVNNSYEVKTEGKIYQLLYAAVTYHKAKPGDKVTIDVPAQGEATWAALENIIHDLPPTEPPVPTEEVLSLDEPTSAQAETQTAVESFFGQPVSQVPTETVEPAITPEPAPIPDPALTPSSTPDNNDSAVTDLAI